tara:strand:+ start:14553 stop:14942 length:390 start_codon:yes stop_codon:yes gene_type:complete
MSEKLIILKKYLYITLGCSCIALGYIGIIIPGIPTTPFLLLSLWFFSRSSESYKTWLLNHKLFGKIIKNWYLYRSIDNKSKLIAILFIIFTFGTSIYYAFPIIVDFIFIIFALILCLFIITRPKPKNVK